MTTSQVVWKASRASKLFGTAIRQFDEQSAIFNFGLKLLLRYIAVELLLARADIELPAVPRAGDNALRQFALRQRPALMRANAVNGEEIAADVKNRNHLLANDEFFAASRRAIVNSGEPMPRHWIGARSASKGRGKAMLTPLLALQAHC
jgi:hypothetical protein